MSQNQGQAPHALVKTDDRRPAAAAGTVSPELRQERNYAQAELFNLRKPTDTETLSVARRIVAAADLPDDVWALLAS